MSLRGSTPMTSRQLPPANPKVDFDLTRPPRSHGNWSEYGLLGRAQSRNLPPWGTTLKKKSRRSVRVVMLTTEGATVSSTRTTRCSKKSSPAASIQASEEAGRRAGSGTRPSAAELDSAVGRCHGRQGCGVQPAPATPGQEQPHPKPKTPPSIWFHRFGGFLHPRKRVGEAAFLLLSTIVPIKKEARAVCLGAPPQFSSFTLVHCFKLHPPASPRCRPPGSAPPV
jgi:hypothetical protein